MELPPRLRFRVFRGQLVFAPMLIPGRIPQTVRCASIPAGSGTSTVTVGTEEIPWDEYQKLPEAVYRWVSFSPGEEPT